MSGGTVTLMAIALLNAIAAVLSLTLLRRAGKRSLPGCAPGSACDELSRSRWAFVGPVPVTVPAALLYVSIAATALDLAFHLPGRPIARQVLSAQLYIAGGAALWFIGLQALILRRICIYCLATHLIAIAALVISLGIIPPSSISTLAGLLALGVIAAIQSFLPPIQHEIRLPEQILPHPATIAAPAVPAAATPRKIVLLGGRLSFDIHVFPRLGSATAPHVIAYLMDYTCEYCRAAHPLIRRAMDDFHGDLTVLICFAPLSPDCNPSVVQVEPRYIHACDYARLAVAVWSRTPAEFAAFHDWLMEGLQPPALDHARSRAGPMPDDVRTPQPIADGTTIYRLTGAGPLPKLLLPTGLLTGQISSPEKLTALLREQLQPAPPAQ